MRFSPRKGGKTMTKEEREEREYKSLFTDERYAKKAWKQFIGESLQSDAANLPDMTDARGNTAPQSVIYNAARQNVKERLRAKSIDREPMKAEVLVEANVIRAAFDNMTFNTLLERTAGKVKDELQVSTGAFEELTDEQLEVLAAHKAQKQLAAPKGDDDDNT